MADDSNHSEAPRESGAPASQGSPGAAPGAPPASDERSFPRGSGAASNAPGASAVPPNALSKPGWFGWQFPLGIGVAAVGAAAARAGILAERAAHARADGASTGGFAPTWVVAAGRVALWAPIEAALGVAALWIIARSLKRPLGDTRLAAARMLAAVGGFHIAWRLGVAPLGVAIFDQYFAFALALAVYLFAVLLAFRVKRDELLMLTGAHAGLAFGARLLVWVIPMLFVVKSQTTQTHDSPPAPPAMQAPAQSAPPASSKPAEPKPVEPSTSAPPPSSPR